MFAPLPPKFDFPAAEKAVRCAVAMQQTVTRFNALRRLDGKLPIWTGIGLDRGQAVVGYTGSTRTMSYTAIGPTVNIASRLCAAARPGESLVSDAVWQTAPASASASAEATRRPALLLKGISVPVEAWSVTVGDSLKSSTAEREAELLSRAAMVVD